LSNLIYIQDRNFRRQRHWGSCAIVLMALPSMLVLAD